MARRPQRRILPAPTLAAAWLVAGAGCASHVHRRVEPRLATVGSHAPSALVFHDPRRGSEPSSEAELARNDAALSARPARARLASDAWPQDDRPSLDYDRRIQFQERAGSFIYFQRPSEAGFFPEHGFGHHHHPVHPWRRLPGDLPPWW